jgi:hypothetical protein
MLATVLVNTLLATAGPTMATLFIAYYYQVGEDAHAVYTTIALGTVLFVASIALFTICTVNRPLLVCF